MTTTTNTNPTTLTELMESLKDDRATGEGYWNWSDLPSFGGEAPTTGTDGVWSWDAANVLVGECASDLDIVTREQWAATVEQFNLSNFLAANEA